ncbi:MAG: hypothetical protein KJZ87_03630 [Thermoguttaceae bacterium]|nr:hypothetical protein [Thermoguttaceae bacterium]
MLDGNKGIRGVDEYKGIDGAIKGRELEWLRAERQMQVPGKPIIVGFHIPIVTTCPQRRCENLPNAPYWEMTNRKTLIVLFAAHVVRLVLQGHMHENERIVVDGVEYAGTISLFGSWFQSGEEMERGVDAAPRGYRNGNRIVSVDGAELAHRCQSSAESRVDRTGEFEGLDNPFVRGGPGRLVFNCFDASASARVRIQLDGGPWRELFWKERPGRHMSARPGCS